ncbi:alpha/beta hydrolase [Flavobacterium sp. MAH-1]|uniref:Alpha/beta hydrolase n=1 Tax=Flavobacterium agri TaxID=2743471 RepID=A0A7Y9C647_9FLAO|nr:alpha/beta hydrolase [Flavobacterium agri]NUY81977.1 alpha/beta hydrolase [Flavobacterium agri]NYA72001.1 alpha/beta hydrolase [Flavobacterium agri]
MKTKRLFQNTTGFLCLAIIASCGDKEPQAEATPSETTTTQVADFSTDPNIDRQTKEFLKVLNSGGKPLESLPLADARGVLEGAQSGVKVDVSGIEESQKTITQDGLTVKLTIVRPEGEKRKLPVFLFIHGGGWVLGDYPTHKRLIRDLVVESGLAAVYVDYSRSPEAKYPVALNEIYAALKWVAANGDEINVDGTKLAIVGNSVGGNMTAATTQRAKDENGPKIKAQVLLWPVADTKFDTESYRKFAKDRFLTESLMKWMFDQYTTDPDQRKEKYISLVNSTAEDLKGLPPTLIQTAENDILRDEGEAYGRKLDEAGVPVTIVRYQGVIHDFGLLNAISQLPATRSHITQAAAELKKHLK